jgi:hypothetical protein
MGIKNQKCYVGSKSVEMGLKKCLSQKLWAKNSEKKALNRIQI